MAVVCCLFFVVMCCLLFVMRCCELFVLSPLLLGVLVFVDVCWSLFVARYCLRIVCQLLLDVHCLTVVSDCGLFGDCYLFFAAFLHVFKFGVLAVSLSVLFGVLVSGGVYLWLIVVCRLVLVVR